MKKKLIEAALPLGWRFVLMAELTDEFRSHTQRTVFQSI
jgi:hypothetical protein